MRNFPRELFAPAALGGTAFAVACIGFLAYPSSLPFELIVSAATLAILVAAAVLVERAIDPSSSIFTPNSTQSIVMALHFVAPVVFAWSDPLVLSSYPPPLLASTYWLVCAAVGMQSLGYLFTRRVFVQREQETALAWDGGLSLVWGMLVVIDVGAKLVRIAAGAYFQMDLTAYGQVPASLWATLIAASSLSQVGYTLSSVLATRTGLRIWRIRSRYVWWMNFLYHLPTGRKESMVILIVLPFLVRAFVANGPPRRRWASVVLAVGVTVMVFMGISIYRTGMAAYFHGGRLDYAEVGEMYAEGNRILSEEGGAVGAAARQAASRISLVDSVFAAHQMTRPGERLHGESLLWTALAPVPRFLWKSKPDFELGNYFGRMHGFVSDTNEQTSISVTFVGELVWNFGPWGILGMFFVGIVNAMIYTFLRPRRSVVGLCVYAAVWPTLAYVGGTFALYYGGMLKAALIVFLVFALGEFMYRRSSALISRR
jgi:hypothetical protein